MIRTGIATAPPFGFSGKDQDGRSLVRSQSPIPAVKPEFPAPVLGLMETPAPVKAPFPVPCVGLMELPTYA